jgi:hypothetical protein
MRGLIRFMPIDQPEPATSLDDRWREYLETHHRMYRRRNELLAT